MNLYDRIKPGKRRRGWGGAVLPRWLDLRCLAWPRRQWRGLRRCSIRFTRNYRCRRRGWAMSCTLPG